LKRRKPQQFDLKKDHSQKKRKVVRGEKKKKKEYDGSDGKKKGMIKWEPSVRSHNRRLVEGEGCVLKEYFGKEPRDTSANAGRGERCTREREGTDCFMSTGIGRNHRSPRARSQSSIRGGAKTGNPRKRLQAAKGPANATPQTPKKEKPPKKRKRRK